jgi:hypothetical protein
MVRRMQVRADRRCRTRCTFVCVGFNCARARVSSKCQCNTSNTLRLCTKSSAAMLWMCVRARSAADVHRAREHVAHVLRGQSDVLPGQRVARYAGCAAARVLPHRPSALARAGAATGRGATRPARARMPYSPTQQRMKAPAAPGTRRFCGCASTRRAARGTHRAARRSRARAVAEPAPDPARGAGG